MSLGGTVERWQWRDDFLNLLPRLHGGLSFYREIHWQKIMTEFEKIYPLYRLLDKVLRQNKTLKKTIRETNKSIIWKLAYPLHIIDDKLRAIRTKNRRSNKRVVTAYE